jgi:hypothetical protein
MRFGGVLAIAVVGMTAVLAAGCRVDTHENGDSKDVKIATPFGGMHVKTNDAVVLEEIGLPAYPGAQPAKNDKDHDTADVNMSFGGFQLRVKTATYRTDDPPEKVEAFYRNGLRRFGDVVKCLNNNAVGTPVRTTEGLTCDNKNGTHITVEEHPGKSKVELRAGSQQHQHIVTIDQEGGGTKFGLVALDLPGNMSSDNDDDKNRQ